MSAFSNKLCRNKFQQQNHSDNHSDNNLHNTLLQKYDRFMFLKLFVDSDDERLKNKYIEAADKHNNKILNNQCPLCNNQIIDDKLKEYANLYLETCQQLQLTQLENKTLKEIIESDARY